MIDRVTIDDSPDRRKVVRSRVDSATACYYPGSHRVVLVADRGDFTAAEAALAELRNHLASMAAKESTA